MKKLLSIILIFVAGNISAQTFPVTTILYNGNSSNHIDLVFLADGFSSAEQTNFITQVNTLTTTIFNTTPYKEYKNLFNVYAIQVSSSASGIKHPVTASDCAFANPVVPASSTVSYFGSTFDYGGTHRLVAPTNTTAIQNVLLANFPAYNKAIIVANSTYYGGSGGTYPCCTINSESAEIVIHELGHSMASLTDEYTSGGCFSTVERPNCTMETNPTLIKWKSWIPGGTTIPTPAGTNCASVGLYLGSNYCPNTWYRPMCNCKMFTLGQPFCSICKEELIVNFLTMANLINSYSPVNTSTINVVSGGSQTFSSTIIQTIPNTIKTQWLMDNVVVATNTLSYTAFGNNLSAGNHTLTFKTWDTTALVKKLVPTNSVAWTINNTGSSAVTLSAFNPVCINVSPFTLTGGSPAGGTYSGTGVSSGIFNPNAAGVGTITITYTYNAQSASQTIQVKPLPVVSVSPSNTSICSGSTTTISASGATTYAWSPSTGLSSTSLASATASPTSTTTYTITGTTNSCSSSSNSVVTVIALPTITISGSTAICSGSSTSLTASGAYSYSWTPSIGLNLTSGASVIANPTSSTTYSITGVANGCSKTQPYTLVVNPLPTITSSANATICLGSSTTLTAAGASTYTWSPSTGLNITTGLSVIANPSSNANYTITGTTNGCSNTKTISITVNASPTVIASGNSSICATTSTTLTVSGATTYSWSPSIGLNLTSGPSVIASPTIATTYTIIGTLNGCGGTTTKSVSIIALPTIIISGNNAICNGSSTSLTASGATTYSWTPSTGLNLTSGASVIANPTSSITYSITGIANGCSKTQPFSLAVNSTPIITSSANATICSGTSTTLTASGANTYTWAPSTGLNITTGASVIANPTTNTTYTITGSNGCIGTKSVSVTVNPLPSPSVISAGGSTTFCTGGSVLLSGNSTGGTWSIGGGTTSTLSATSTGDYFTTTSNSCGSAISNHIAVSVSASIPSTPSSIIGNSGGNCNTTGTYSVSLVSGVTYNWIAPTYTSITSGQGTNIVTVNFSSSFVSGSLKVNASNGCGTSSNRTKSLTSKPSTPSSISGPSTGVCINSVQTYNTPLLNGATSYTWTVPTGSTIQTGQGTNYITVLIGSTSGNISVKASNGCGTSYTKYLAITVGSCVKLEDHLSDNRFYVSPNPCNTCQINGELNEHELIITDILGRIVSVEFIKSENGFYLKMPLEKVSGLYFVRNIKTGQVTKFEKVQ